MDEYREGIRLQPDMAAAHPRLGVLQMSMGHLDSAPADLKDEYRRNPQKFELNFYLGYALKRLEKPEEAEKYLRRASELRPDTFQSLFQLALVEQELGRQNLALDLFERVERQHPEESEVHVNLARLYFKAGKHEVFEREHKTIPRLTAENQSKELPQNHDELP